MSTRQWITDESIRQAIGWNEERGRKATVEVLKHLNEERDRLKRKAFKYRRVVEGVHKYLLSTCGGNQENVVVKGLAEVLKEEE